MKPEKLVEQIKSAIEKNKDWTPLLGALIGYMLSGDQKTQKKIVNSLIGAGLGYLVGNVMVKKSDEEDEEDEEDEDEE